MAQNNLSYLVCTLFALLLISCDAESITQPGANGNGNGDASALIIGGSNDDTGFSVIQTFDGSFVIVGNTASLDGDFAGQNLGGQDLFALKLDTNGDIEWIHNFGGNNIDGASDVIEDQAGNIVIAGHTMSNSGNFTGQLRGESDAIMIKLTPEGTLLWARTYGGSNEDYAHALTEGPNGGYILTGSTRSIDGNFSNRNNSSSDVFLMLTDMNGEPAWVQTFGGTSDDEGLAVSLSQQNGIVVTGSFASTNGTFTNSQPGNRSFFVIETELNGNPLGLSTYGGSGIDIANAIITTSDGGYAVSGTSNSVNGHFSDENLGGFDAFIMKLNANRQIEWVNNFGGSGYDEARSLLQTGAGNFIMAGETASDDMDFEELNKGNLDAFMMRINAEGERLRAITIGGSNEDAARTITQLSDGRFAITGYSQSTNGDFSVRQNTDQDIFFLIESLSSGSE